MAEILKTFSSLLNVLKLIKSVLKPDSKYFKIIPERFKTN